MNEAVWVSHSSISDYMKCPRAYYLKNVYRNPENRRKISIMTPALALGQAVHQVLENLSTIPLSKRFDLALTDFLPKAWEPVSGKFGGFSDKSEEEAQYARAEMMLKRVMQNPGPLASLAVRIVAPSNLPRFTLSETEQLILCGKIDWLEYIATDNSVRIIDFKTGRNEEHESSLQLPIYNLLVDRLQKRRVSSAAYWYLDRDESPQEMPLPDLQKAELEILQLARDIKWARQTGYRSCQQDGCFACKDYQAILDGEAELVGQGNYGQDIYVIT